MRKAALLFVALLLSAAPASASPVAVSVAVSGSPGAYFLDFSLSNNIPASYNQGLYFFGVDLPDDAAQGIPTGWDDWGGTWNNQGYGYGGSNRNYPSTWSTFSSGVDRVFSGGTLSGFTLHLNAATVPGLIHFYAFGVGNGYYESDAFYQGGNPGFEGTVGGAQETPPVPEPASMILVGSGLVAAVLRKRRA